MTVYRYTFNPWKCNKFTIESRRGKLFYPSELDGNEYFSVRDNEDVDVQFGITDSIHLKNEWFDIEELDANRLDVAIETDGFQVFADSLRDLFERENIKDHVTFESFLEGISKHLCIRNFGLKGGAWECEGSAPPIGVCKECWRTALSRKYKE